MVLNVDYETKDGTISKKYIGNDKSELLKRARNCKEYKNCFDATFELREVADNGDKCI